MYIKTRKQITKMSSKNFGRYYTKKENEELLAVPEIDYGAVSHRAKAEAEIKLEELNNVKRELIDSEKKILDKDSEQMKKILVIKKDVVDKIAQTRIIFERNNVPLEDISIAQINKLIGTLHIEIKNLDEEILNEDDEPAKLEAIMDILKKYRDHLIIMESQLRQESINEFMNKATKQRTQAIRNDSNKIFNIARSDAEQRAASIFLLDQDEIRNMFQMSKKFVSWSHIIRNRDEDIIPLTPGVAIPERFNQKTKQMEDYVFRLSSLFRNPNPRFMKIINDHYHPMGLDLTITQDAKYKNKWWIRLQCHNSEIIFGANNV